MLVGLIGYQLDTSLLRVQLVPVKGVMMTMTMIIMIMMTVL